MASWKKVIVSGSDAVLSSVSASNYLFVDAAGVDAELGNVFQTISSNPNDTWLTGSFKGDGSRLTNVTGSKVDVDNTTENIAGRILFTGADTDKALQACNSANLTFNASQCRLSTGQITATGFTGSFNGNVDTATTATCVNLTNASDSTNNSYIPFADGATGGQDLCTDNTFYYTPNTDTLTVTNIAGTATNATTASAVTVTDSDGNTNYTLVFATTGTGTKELLSNDALTYNADSNLLTTGGTVVVGSGTNTATVSSNGNHDLILQTGGAASSITLEQGADQNIQLDPNGAGVVKIGGDNSIVTATENTLTLGDGSVNVCVTNDLNVGGDLIVSGELAYLNVTNLAVEDKFILLNSGSAGSDVAGIVVDEGAPSGSGHALMYSNSRWGFTSSLSATNTSATPDAFAAAVVTSDIAEYQKNGNIRVDTGNGDIYIYS